MSGASTRISKQHLLATTKSLWWVFPITVGLFVGLLFAQDSRFQSEPARVETTRRFEGFQPLSSLVALEIDAQAFAPNLSIGGAIAQFNSDDANLKRNESNGFDVKLLVSQVPGDFNAVNREITERNTVYTYISVGSGIFNLVCTEASEKDCARALDVGAAEFSEARSSAIQASISAVADKIDARLSAVRELISSTNNDTALLAQRQLEAELFSQVSVLRMSINEPAFALNLIDERVEAISETVSSVNSSTYFLGLILGLIVGVLIILQFAVLRSRRA